MPLFPYGKFLLPFCLTLAFTSLTLSVCSQSFIPGNVYFDSTGFVEYRAGNLPIILSAPHGGSLQPDSIPDRDCTGCSYLQDAYTKPITEGLYDEIFAQTGCYPHVVINLLHRVKFDANRDIGDAADGNPLVEQAWRGYHAFIDSAKGQIEMDYTRGVFLDIHGHGHSIQRIELGYLLSAAELRLPDATLNTNTFIEESSLKTLVSDNIQLIQHAELIRGADSFGTLMHERGFPAVPSALDSFPIIGEPYFSGGYNTVRHGSRDNGGQIDAIQIELNQDIRFNAASRQVLVDTLAYVSNHFYNLHYNDQYHPNYCGLLLPVELLDFSASAHQGSVRLNWSTISEFNNHEFLIERKNKMGQFEKIGTIQGKGNSNVQVDYQYIDQSPLPGSNYYRLRQEDDLGDYSYSPVIHIEMMEEYGLNIYPNPAFAQKVNLEINTHRNDDLLVAVMDWSGKVHGDFLFAVTRGNNLLEIPLAGGSPGVYFVKLKIGNHISFHKLVVQ